MQPTDLELFEESLEKTTQLLCAAGSLAVLTGAGVSAESGLPTFRGSDGLWEGHRIEDVATPHAFARNPTLVWKFYNLRRAALGKVKPNAGHDALVSLESHFRGNFTLITQNVDGLHRAAGSDAILELHGNLRRVRCTGCGMIEDRGHEPLAELPRCLTCGELLRPDVVWFEEMLPPQIWAAAERAACACDCFLIAGTSAVVYPAAGLVSFAKDHGAKIIEVNVAQSEATSIADVCLLGPSGILLPELVKRL